MKKDTLELQRDLFSKKDKLNLEHIKKSSTINKIENSLTGVIQCPNCNFEFSLKEKRCRY